MSKRKVLLVELHIMKRRLGRTDVWRCIRWSHREPTSFWETQVSTNLQTWSEKQNIALSVRLSHTSTENANVTCLFPEGLEDPCLQREATAQHCGPTGDLFETKWLTTVWNIQLLRLRMFTQGLHSGWEPDTCQENKPCSQGFPHKFPKET